MALTELRFGGDIGQVRRSGLPLADPRIVDVRVVRVPVGFDANPVAVDVEAIEQDRDAVPFVVPVAEVLDASVPRLGELVG